MRKMMNRLINAFNKIPVSKKITLIYSLFFLVLLVTVSSFMLLNAWMYYGRISRSELEETADKIVNHIEENGYSGSENIEQLNPNKYVKVVVTERKSEQPPTPKPNQRRMRSDVSESTTENTRTGESAAGSNHGFPPPEFDQHQSADDNDDMHFKMGEFNNQHYLYAMRMAHYGDMTYSVQVFRSQNREMEVMRFFIIIFVVINAVALLLSVAISRFISVKMLKPVREMTKTAESISAKDLSSRVEVPEADDELRSLAITFNNMFDRLEDSFEKQKQFVSDASHELRTPISVIQGYANLIDRWGKSDEEVLNESISSIKSETEHMSILINQLLFLAREDKGTSVINNEKINLWELVSEAASETEMTNSPDEVKCSLTGCKNAFILADSHLIKQTVRIIIENAIKYTKNKPCKIAFGIETGGGKVLLSITDNGIGIPSEDIENIFDRFYRSDKSRNKQIPGNGLGLSIAKSIVEKHGGKIWAKSTSGEGSTFYIELNEEK